MKFHGVKKSVLTDEQGTCSLHQIEHVDAAVSTDWQFCRCADAVGVQKFPFMQPGAFHGSIFSLVYEGDGVDQILPYLFCVAVPLDVCRAVVYVDRPRPAVQIEPSPVPQLECKDVGCGAYFQHHGVCAGAVDGSCRYQYMVVFFYRDTVDISFGRKRSASCLRFF